MYGSQADARLPSLPGNFPGSLPTPRFQIGDRVRWHPIPAEDFGVIVGLNYAPAPHLTEWHWQYLVWLDADSPSRAWMNSEVAWEADLELLVDSGSQATGLVDGSAEESEQ
ncbi:hypothetical protein [Leptolyngbya ohadii]|uniref:hypothetical protein n=1 Tax=Leptolyngbya ohadii TaxID=1962290 RepID=UPI0015C5E894|nr:hypothetical protein [Leptolyngbya ohadii]